MKMGNPVPRVGLESTFLPFQASGLPLHHVGFPEVTTIPMPTCLCSAIPQSSVQTTKLVPPLMLTVTYRQWPYIYIFTGQVQ